MNFEYAQRVKRLPPYLFAEMEKIQKEKKAHGVDLISLSIGDPDLPPPDFVVDALANEVSDLKNHNYSFSQGEHVFREAVCNWYKNRFGIDVTHDQVVALLGSKEGIANIARAFVNNGDKVLVPDPAYPVYANGSTILCDGLVVPMPLLEDNNFQPDLDIIDTDNVRMMFLNYPNNPTAATVDKHFLKKTVDFAKDNNIILCYDNAYSEITYDNYRAPSILEISGADEVAIEFNSLSKTFNMTGDRIAFAVGNKQLVAGLTKIKSQIDSGPPVYIQKVAAAALGVYKNSNQPEFLRKNNQVLQERRDLLVNTLTKIGYPCEAPMATFYVWVNCKEDSVKFTTKLLDVGVAVTPGIGFGKYGEGYVRITFTQPKERIKEACERIVSIF
ncbi:MAG: aminotransferase class I/II-fold pyridoxal phosphate-dependent enzyme [Nitrososphaerota archaeon]|jgi:LL-diaminopimelate aminotransferase|nr:aminotransferase class I/II-fold pyridoxal phosphate-dependent enzyme [Candidatus Termiticorpusculum sp.]MCL2292590.1 aminotransferase class I/II-fold pyridoxal phosphate-dependent enzyme [Candidatus Termiticorpusculum sp.]MDR0460191.1 aminotransferase class I/II-fold pyridoxal phosphate-dependent enzyme [Nitrososphaerota archaeon]